MKPIDIDDMDQLPGQRIGDGETFNFRCHPGVSCFNLCCRNLNLFLYPYDVVRLKSQLRISSDTFLDRYVDVVLRPETFFPEVLLRMSDNEDRTCPFLTDAGCSVYPDRPDTCRTFPVEQGSFYNAGTRKSGLVRFFRPPDFCMGRHEEKSWTPDSWARDQDAVVYNRMTFRWAELRRLFQTDPWGGGGSGWPQGENGIHGHLQCGPFQGICFPKFFSQAVQSEIRRVEEDAKK